VQLPDEIPMEPFPEAFEGNILFGGLPLKCGPLSLAAHVQNLEQLGRVLEARSDYFAERYFGELLEQAKQEVEIEKKLNERISAVFESVAEDIHEQGGVPAILEQVRAARAAEEPDPRFVTAVSESLGTRLEELSGEIAWDFAIVPVRFRGLAELCFANFLLESPERGVSDLFQGLSHRDRKRWRLPEEMDGRTMARLQGISTEALLLGLHEFLRAPWSPAGGLVAERAATDDYLDALQRIDRDVFAAYALVDWYTEAPARAHDFSSRLSDLIDSSIPFGLSEQVQAVLSHVTRTYLRGEPAVSVLLARSALETVIREVYQKTKVPMPTEGLSTQTKALKMFGILSDHAFRCAEELRLRGNKATHQNLEMYGKDSHGIAAVRSLRDLILELREHLEVEGGEPEG
jgi:hypothetical protein